MRRIACELCAARHICMHGRGACMYSSGEGAMQVQGGTHLRCDFAMCQWLTSSNSTIPFQLAVFLVRSCVTHIEPMPDSITSYGDTLACSMRLAEHPPGAPTGMLPVHVQRPISHLCSWSCNCHCLAAFSQ